MVDEFVIPVQRLVVRDFVDVFQALTEFRRTFSAHLLRKLKEHVYELVLSGDPKSRLVVADIDDVTHMNDVEVVFGVGIANSFGEHGYVGLDRWDLLDDVLNDDRNFNPNKIVDVVLPRILSGSVNVPVFKYLREAGCLKADGTLRKDSGVLPKIERMADKIRSGLPASAHHVKKADAVLSRITSIRQLESELGVEGVFNYGTLMKPRNVDPKELQEFLIRNPCTKRNTWNDTQWVKLVCFYDWLSYGRS
jgi:hypothetical protein